MNRDALELIDQLVLQYGDSARDIIIQGLGIESKGTNRYKCPNGHAHKNGDKNPSMGWVSGKNYFHCQGCGENINIYTYYKNYLNYTFNEIMQDSGIESIETNRNLFNEKASKRKSLKPNQIEFLTKRGVTLETAKQFKLIDLEGFLGIPYFKNGTLTGIKKRNMGAGVKNLSADGSKFFFFNFDETEFNKTLIVTEGEFDCIVMIQSGFENVVSVGCGANSTASLFDNFEEYFKKFPQIILVTDNDKNGNEMDKAFIDKFGVKISTVDKSLYLDCKDANEVFLKHGTEQLKKIVNSGKAQFDGEWNLEENPYKKLDPADVKFIDTGLETLDDAMNSIQSKYVTLITGRSNAGKSTFVNQIISSAISQNFKVFLALGEGNKDKIVNKFYTSLVGNNFEYYDTVKFGRKEIKEPKERVLTAIQKWHKNKLRLWVKSMSKMKTHTEMFEMLEYKVKTEKYDLIILDNQMSLLTVEKSSDKLEKQAEFVQMCHELADATNCAVVLILHPNKTYKKGEEMDFEQISGTSDIANKADMILNVIRVPDSELDKSKSMSHQVTSKIQLAKNRDDSDLPTVDCVFDKRTYTFAEVKGGVIKSVKAQGWIDYLETEPKNVKYYNGTEQTFANGEFDDVLF